MQAKAIHKYVRISPRKVRLVLDIIRGKKVHNALVDLSIANKGAVETVQKVLKSAIANADEKYPEQDVDALIVKEAYADEGPVLKRFRARAMGRGARINKRTSHITVVVSY